MAKKITGNYATISEAEAAVQALISEGYPTESITLIVDKKSAPSLQYQDIHVESVAHDDADESMWERIKGFFGGEDEEAMRQDYYDSYRDDISRGHILVSVDTDRVPEGFEHGTVSTGHAMAHDPITEADAMTDMTAGIPPVEPVAPVEDDVLRMREERLDVSKENVQTGEAVVKKVVTEETQTVEVPVTKEELVIERTPVNDELADDPNFRPEESEIRIPLSEERVHVTKEPVVTEEVHISKREVQDTESVSDTVHKEHLNVESTDDSIIQDVDDPMDKRM